MLEIFCSDSKSKDLFEDYWGCDESGRFIYKQNNVVSKYGLKSYKELEKIIVNSGYALIKNKKYRCPDCHKRPKLFFRRDIKNIFITNSLICENCRKRRTEEQIVIAYLSSFRFIDQFNKIYDANLNNKYSSTYDGLIGELSFLELIYLYVIINNNKINDSGRLGFKKFKLFLHHEFYLENEILKKISDKSLLFYITDTSIKEKIQTIKFFKNYNKGREFSELFQYINEFDAQETNLFNIIFKPKNMNFKEYEKFLSECIEKYRLSLSEWAVLSFFLKKIRKNEILFLEKVIKYNLEFKLLWDNGVDYKIEFLKDFYSLRNIYGYFYASVNAALYKLDYLPDQEGFVAQTYL